MNKLILYVLLFMCCGLKLTSFSQITINDGERVRIYSDTRVDVTGNAVIESGATLIIGGEMTVSGSVTNNGSNSAITINSDASTTGSLIFGSGTPGATVQRYIAGSTDASFGWHLISSPVASQAISTFHTAGSGNDFYKWDETIDMWVNRTAAGGGLNGDFETNFGVGTGYLIANSSTSTPEFSGTLNNSDVSITGLTNTSTGYSYEGWHLLGNPFSSSIKWNDGNWSLGGTIGGNCQIWNESDASYTVLSANDTIPTTNGFMVYTSASSGSLTIPKAARVHNTGGSVDWYKNTNNSDNRIVLVAVDPQGQTSQKTILRFNSDASNGFDLAYDSYFMAGYAPMFYSISGSNYYALNTMPYQNSETVIPIGFIKNNNSQFYIELLENENNLDIYIIDKKDSNIKKLNEGNYAFTSSNGDDQNRFEIRFGIVGLEEEIEQSNNSNVWYSRNKLFVTQATPGTNLQVFDLLGRVVYTYTIDAEESSLQLDLNSGIYLVHYNNNTTKIFISR